MKLYSKNLNFNLSLVITALLTLSSCDKFKNWSAPSLLGAGLTPQERQNPQIKSAISNAQRFNLAGVTKDINTITSGPTSKDCQRASEDEHRQIASLHGDESPFAPLKSKKGKRAPIRLWATQYNTPVYKVDKNSVPLKKNNEKNISYRGRTVGLSKRKWCMAAMEGSVSIRMHDGVTKTYNYAGTGSMQVDCRPYFAGRHHATGRVKFSEVKSVWGVGVRNYSLVPYRTIAVNPKTIPYGSVVFIEQAKGKKITLADGTTFIHDGYFFAGDTGGAMRKNPNQIDVFTGNNPPTNLSFIRSKASGTFKAEIVNDPKIEAKLASFHRRIY